MTSVRAINTLGAALGIILCSVSAGHAADCKKNGVMMEQIACIEAQNETDAKALGAGWRQAFEKIQRECAKDWPGGGSGGREDRATCVAGKIKKAAKKG